MLVDMDRMVSCVWGSGGDRGPPLGDVGSHDVSDEATESEVRRLKSMAGGYENGGRVELGEEGSGKRWRLLYRLRGVVFSSDVPNQNDVPRRLS